MLTTVRSMKRPLLSAAVLAVALAFSMAPAGVALAVAPTNPGEHNETLDCLAPDGIEITPEGVKPLIEKGPQKGSPADDFSDGVMIDEDGTVTILAIPTPTATPNPTPDENGKLPPGPGKIQEIPEGGYDDAPEGMPLPPDDGEHDDWPRPGEDHDLLCDAPCDSLERCGPIGDGSLTISAGDPIAASEEAAKLVRDAGGRITERTAYAPDDGEGHSSDLRSATLVLSIPSAKLSETLDRLEALGTLESLQVRYPDRDDENAMSTISLTIDADESAVTVPGFFWGALLAGIGGLILCAALAILVVLLVVRQRRRNARATTDPEPPTGARPMVE